MTIQATGEQITLRHGDQEAVVVQVGGGLRTYDVGGRAVLDGFRAADMPDGGRGQVLAPWPNRVRDGVYPWEGSNQQLALSEAKAHNAIHGLVRWAEWSVVDRAAARASLMVRVWPQTGYPFQLEVTAEYQLSDTGLTVSLTGRNDGDRTLPFGVGQHPYVTVGTELVDDAVLTVPAAVRLRSDDRGLPAGTESVDGTPYDFRVARRIGAIRLDTPYTELSRDTEGRVVVRLAHPGAGHGVDVWMGRGGEFLQVYTGDTLAEPRRRRGVAVEPMSCAPDAFNSGAGLARLAPGESHTLIWGLRAW